MNGNNKEEYFDFSELIIYLSNQWWKICITMMVGGIIGLLISNQIRTLFESSATFSVTIDYRQTGALSDVQEDQAMRGVGSVIFSDRVIDQTLNQLQDSSYRIEREDFYQNAFLDRNEFRWTIRFRDHNPQNAQQVITIWGKNAESILSEGLKSALIVDSYYLLLDGLKNCLQRQTIDNGSGQICGFSSTSELLDEIQYLALQIQAEKENSQGLFSALSVEMVEAGRVSEKPVRYNQNTLVLSGAIIGLIVSIFYYSLRKIIREK